jgi:hypothetical protein
VNAAWVGVDLGRGRLHHHHGFDVVVIGVVLSQWVGPQSSELGERHGIVVERGGGYPVVDE